MRKPLQLTLAASALAAAVVAAVLLVGRSPAITTGAPAAPLLSASADNMSLISDLKDERVFRDRQLRMDGAAVEGDGVSMPAPGVLEITPPLNFTANAAWAPYRTDLTAPFSAAFTVTVSDPLNGGADGVAFVLQADPLGARALGGLGSSLGIVREHKGPGGRS